MQTTQTTSKTIIITAAPIATPTILPLYDDDVLSSSELSFDEELLPRDGVSAPEGEVRERPGGGGALKVSPPVSASGVFCAGCAFPGGSLA